MAKIISIISVKGGVCKTTCAVNLATLLAERGHRVLLVDADGPQHAAYAWVKDDADRQAKEVAGATPSEIRNAPAFTKVDIVTEPQNVPAVIEKNDRLYDYIIIDVLGGDSVLLTGATANSDLAIIPTGDAQKEVRGAILTSLRLRQIEVFIGRTIEHRVLYSRVDPRTSVYGILKAQMHEAGLPLMATEIRQRVLHKEAFILASIPSFIRPSHPAAEEMEAFVDEVLSVLDGRAAIAHCMSHEAASEVAGQIAWTKEQEV